MKNGKISKKEKAYAMYLAGIKSEDAAKDIVACKGYIGTLYSQFGMPQKEEYKNKWVVLLDSLNVDESYFISCETIEECEKMKLAINTSLRRYNEKQYSTRILFIKKQVLIIREK